MEIYFKTARTTDMRDVTPKVTAIATKKLNNLKKYLEYRRGIAKVYVELGKESGAHQQGNIWRTQINLDCDGKRFHVAATNEKLETAIAKAISELEQELRKAKQLHYALMVKGGTVLKRLVQNFSL